MHVSSFSDGAQNLGFFILMRIFYGCLNDMVYFYINIYIYIYIYILKDGLCFSKYSVGRFVLS